METSTVVAIVVSVVTVVISVITARQAAKREFLSAIEQAQISVQREIDTLKDIIARLRERVEDLERENLELKKQYRALCAWVRRQGLDPDDHWKEIDLEADNAQAS